MLLGSIRVSFLGYVPFPPFSSRTITYCKSCLKAWIEASTKGAVLLFTASEIESASVNFGVNPAAAGLLGGMGGGIAQAYATMGEYLEIF